MRSFNDLETYSETPINCGAHRYAENAEVLLWSFALDDAPVQVWDVTSGARMPSALYDQLADERNEVWFHNMGMFDAVVLQHVGPSLGMPPVAMSRWRDTMVLAYMHSLPGALEKLGTVLGLADDMQKLKTGKDLVRLFCQPRPANQKLRRATRETHPAEWADFVRYAGGDIVAMRECLAKMPKWNGTEREWALWHLDLCVNYRGVAIDTQLVEAAITAADKAQAVLADQVQELTAGDVMRATQRDELLRHLCLEHGVQLPDLQADTLERRMQDPDLPPAVKDLLGIRLQASTTSVSKYKALAKSVSSDGRLRGTLQFRGAMRTGRWSGRIFQPQNLPRPALKQRDIELGIESVKLGCETLLYDNVMELLSSAIRGALVAGPGKKLCIADLSNIEGRVVAWLAGESWKLQAFRDFDAGRGADLYAVAYAKAFAVTPESVMENKKTGDGLQRQIGKVMELMLGYQGGVGAFITGAATYGIDLDDMAEKALPSVPYDVYLEAEQFWQWTKDQKRSTFGLEREVFTACDALKRLWRRAHPAIESLWTDLEDAVRAAIQQPGQVFQVRRLKTRRVGSWLQLRLPSGRNLSYPMVRVEPDNSISYMGQDQYTRQWKRLKTYGGKLVENVTQAVACDQLAECMPLIEAAGYPIVLSVHDELLTETPDSDEFSAAQLAELMTSDLGWNDGLPLAAAGYETYRYRKD
jgi:DNA polymerase